LTSFSLDRLNGRRVVQHFFFLGIPGHLKFGKCLNFQSITHFHTAYCAGKMNFFSQVLIRRKITESPLIAQINAGENIIVNR
jgi:hypothetical protein